MRNLIDRLHREKKYEHAIAVIESCLANGQSQPWMYDILALTMGLAKRPEADIERVLLSRVDFSSVDVPSMMYSAAYLTRFDCHRQALKLYQQASRLQATRPEPYVLGLKLARQCDDPAAVQWAVCGILTHAWTPGHQQLQRDAENVAMQLEDELREGGREDEADALHAAVAQAKQRDLTILLSWNGDGDLDLEVEEPPGTVCSLNNPHTAGGGALIHDGYGPKQENCFEEYICALGMPGAYRVRIRHVVGNIVGKRAQLTIIRYRGTSRELTRTLSVPLDRRQKTVRVSLKQGRRRDLRPTVKREMAVRRGRRRPRAFELARRGEIRASARFADSRRIAAAPPGVGFQPVIAQIAEGAFLSATAVISGDRRYVRISAFPQFNTITDVFTFSFINNGGNPNGGGGGGGIRSGGGGQGGGGGGGPGFGGP